MKHSRLFGLLTALILALGLMLATAATAEAASYDSIYVNGKELAKYQVLIKGKDSPVNSLPSDINTGYARYMGEGYLILSDFDVTDTIDYYGDMQLQIQGECTITEKNAPAIEVEAGSLIIKGSSNSLLTVKSTGSTAINVSGGNCTFYGGTVNVVGDTTAAAVNVWGEVSISDLSNSAPTISITNTNGRALRSQDLTVTGGTLTATSDRNDAIYCGGDFDLQAGSVTAKTLLADGYTVLTASTITNSGGNLYVTSPMANRGIYAVGDITITAGINNVNISGKGELAYGLYTTGTLTVDGGVLIVANNSDVAAIHVLEDIVLGETDKNSAIAARNDSTGGAALRCIDDITVCSGFLQTAITDANVISTSSHCIVCNDLTVKGGEVTASGDFAVSDAVIISGDLTIYDGEMNVSGGIASAGISGDGVMVTGDVTLQGGTLDVDVYGRALSCAALETYGGTLTLTTKDAFDTLTTTGDVVLQGGTITVSNTGTGDAIVSGGAVKHQMGNVRADSAAGSAVRCAGLLLDASLVYTFDATAGGKDAAVYVSGDMTAIRSTATIENTGTAQALYVTGALQKYNTGELTAKAAKNAAIYCYTLTTAGSGSTLAYTHGLTAITQNNSYGIYTFGDIDFAAVMNVNVRSSGTGIYSDTGSLYLRKGAVTIESTYDGIYLEYGGVNLSGGTLKVTSTSGTGINTEDGVFVSGTASADVTGSVYGVGGGLSVEGSNVGKLIFRSTAAGTNEHLTRAVGKKLGTLNSNLLVTASTEGDGSVSTGYDETQHSTYDYIYIRPAKIYLGGIGLGDGDVLVEDEVVSAKADCVDADSTDGYAAFNGGVLTLSGFDMAFTGDVPFINHTGGLNVQLMGNSSINVPAGIIASDGLTFLGTDESANRLSIKANGYGVKASRVTLINCSLVIDAAIGISASGGTVTVNDGALLDVTALGSGIIARTVTANGLMTVRSMTDQTLSSWALVCDELICGTGMEILAAEDPNGTPGAYDAAKLADYDLIVVQPAVQLAAPVVKASNNADTGKVELSWEPVSGAAKYEVYRATSKTGTYTKIWTIPRTTCTNTSAVAGKSYYYKVRAIDANGVAGPYSEIVNRVCDCARPMVKATNDPVTGKNILSWDAVEGATKYELYRSTSLTGTYEKIWGANKTTVTHSGTPGVTYYYKVRAFSSNASATSAYSKIVQRTADYAKPVVKATNNADSGKVVLSWEAVKGATKYELYRATSKTGTYSKIWTGTTTSVTHNGTPGTTYYYKVRALGSNSNATSAYSEIVQRTADYAKPVVKATNNATTGKVVLSWEAVSGATKYELYRATSVNGTYTKIWSSSKTTVTHSGTPGTTYYYKVRALGSNSNATSAFSAIVQRTADYAKPVVTVKLNENGKPVLSWDAVKGATKYEVYRATSENGTYTKIWGSSATTCTHTGAVSGTTYYYKVRALGSNTNATSAYSAVVSIKAK